MKKSNNINTTTPFITSDPPSSTTPAATETTTPQGDGEPTGDQGTNNDNGTDHVVVHERQKLQLCAVHTVNNLLQLSSSCSPLSDRKEEKADDLENCDSKIIIETDTATETTGRRRRTKWFCRGIDLKRAEEQTHPATKAEFDGIADELTIAENRLLLNLPSSVSSHNNDQDEDDDDDDDGNTCRSNNNNNRNNAQDGNNVPANKTRDEVSCHTSLLELSSVGEYKNKIHEGDISDENYAGDDDNDNYQIDSSNQEEKGDETTFRVPEPLPDPTCQRQRRRRRRKQQHEKTSNNKETTKGLTPSSLAKKTTDEGSISPMCAGEPLVENSWKISTIPLKKTGVVDATATATAMETTTKPSLRERLNSNHRTPVFGNYSFEVMETALKRRGVELNWFKVNDDNDEIAATLSAIETKPIIEDEDEKGRQPLSTESTTQRGVVVIGFILNAVEETSWAFRYLRYVPLLRNWFDCGRHWYAITRIRRVLVVEGSMNENIANSDLDDGTQCDVHDVCDGTNPTDDESSRWMVLNSDDDEVQELMSDEELVEYLRAVQSEMGANIFRATVTVPGS